MRIQSNTAWSARRKKFPVHAYRAIILSLAASCTCAILAACIGAQLRDAHPGGEIGVLERPGRGTRDKNCDSSLNFATRERERARFCELNLVEMSRTALACDFIVFFAIDDNFANSIRKSAKSGFFPISIDKESINFSRGRRYAVVRC